MCRKLKGICHKLCTTIMLKKIFNTIIIKKYLMIEERDVYKLMNMGNCKKEIKVLKLFKRAI